MGEANFDGFSAPALPSIGTVLTARWAVPVWMELQPPGQPDVSRVQARLAAAGCVQVLGAQTSSNGRPWAEVKPAECTARSPAAR